MAFELADLPGGCGPATICATTPSITWGAVIGSQTYRRVQLVMEGRNRDLRDCLSAGGALPPVFSALAEAMTNQHFDGRAVLGCSVDELRSPAWRIDVVRTTRVGVMDNYLLRLMAQSTHIDVVPVARELLRRRGCVRIAAMAERAGLRVRQFERRFRSLKSGWRRNCMHVSHGLKQR